MDGDQANDLFVLDTGLNFFWCIRGLSDLVAKLCSADAMMWYRPKVKGDPPCPRSFHTATLVGSKIIFFGGNHQSEYLNDIYLFDTRTRSLSPSLKDGYSNMTIQTRFNGRRQRLRESCQSHAVVTQLHCSALSCLYSVDLTERSSIMISTHLTLVCSW